LYDDIEFLKGDIMLKYTYKATGKIKSKVVEKFIWGRYD